MRSGIANINWGETDFEILMRIIFSCVAHAILQNYQYYKIFKNSPWKIPDCIPTNKFKMIKGFQQFLKSQSSMELTKSNRKNNTCHAYVMIGIKINLKNINKTKRNKRRNY